MRKVQLSIIQLLGTLDHNVSFSIIPFHQENSGALAWDTVNHVQFSFPYQQIKLDVYLDEILPGIVDRALHSSDRQSKIAACELLHSVIILMIGTGMNFFVYMGQYLFIFPSRPTAERVDAIKVSYGSHFRSCV